MAATMSASAPRTKPPTIVGLGFLAMVRSLCVGRPAARQKLPDALVGRMRQQGARRSACAEGPRRGVEVDAVVADGEDARQLVRDDDHRRAEAVAQLDDQLVE